VNFRLRVFTYEYEGNNTELFMAILKYQTSTPQGTPLEYKLEPLLDGTGLITATIEYNGKPQEFLFIVLFDEGSIYRITDDRHSTALKAITTRDTSKNVKKMSGKHFEELFCLFSDKDKQVSDPITNSFMVVGKKPYHNTIGAYHHES
jgi:hypothetical protein